VAATWQAGDTAPPIRFTISEDGSPLDLAELTVRLRFGPKGQAATFQRECTVDDADAGTCHMDWTEDDLAESGDYEGQLVLQYPPAEGEQDGRQRLSAPFEISVARSIPAPPEPQG
jgi:hypothetical protein